MPSLKDTLPYGLHCSEITNMCTSFFFFLWGGFRGSGDDQDNVEEKNENILG